jgi:ABC transport system ATP-binding/permease protein
MTVLTVESIAKSYGVKPLLEDVSFSLEHNGKMGVIGPNGSGKSTLLRIIAGLERPDGGAVTFPSGTRVTYLPQNPPLNPDHTVLDAVFDQGDDALRLLHDYEEACVVLEADPTNLTALERVTDLSHELDVTGGWDLESNARAVLDRLGITEMTARVAELSGGQKKRIALAAALVLRPDLLILDEPTNHLDPDTIAWLEGYLGVFTGALLLVTHDRYFLDRVTDRMLEIENGEVQRYEGNYTRYLELKDAQTERQGAEAQKKASLARRELAWLRRGAKARTTKQKARVDRAEALLAEPKKLTQRQIELDAPSARLGRKVIELQGIAKAYGEENLIEDFSYIFTREDRIGIIGPNGSGKTTLLEMIAGRVAPDRGRIEIGPTVAIGYYDQESRALDDEMRIIDYVREVAENVVTSDGSVISASQLLDRFLFPPAQQYTPVGLLSGGERRRLYLARILMGAPNVLILDEPTNDLDIPTLVALEDYLETFPGCLIAVSHDRYFLDRTVDQLFRFDGEGDIRIIPGNYSAYLEVRAREEAQRAAADANRRAAPQVGNGQAAARDEPPKLSYQERKELEELEKRIASAEARQALVETALAESPDDYERVAALSAEHQDLAQRLEQDVERWAELAERA